LDKKKFFSPDKEVWSVRKMNFPYTLQMPQKRPAGACMYYKALVDVSNGATGKFF
jgi:hypothetical protein